MKTNHIVLGALAAVGIFSATSSYAVIRLGWERPIYQSQMEVRGSIGGFKNAKQVKLVMTKQDGQNKITGFVLHIDDQVIRFKNVQNSFDSCGSVEYSAYIDGRMIGDRTESYKFTLTDHSNRSCTGFRPFKWEASIEHSKLLDRIVEKDSYNDSQKVIGLDDFDSNRIGIFGAIELIGNPVPVYTVQ